MHRAILCGTHSVTEHSQILSVFLIEYLLVALLSMLFACLCILFWHLQDLTIFAINLLTIADGLSKPLIKILKQLLVADAWIMFYLTQPLQQVMFKKHLIVVHHICIGILELRCCTSLQEFVMVFPLLTLVPQQRISLDFKSRHPLTRSFFLFFFVIPRRIELFNMVVEFGVT